MRHSQNQSSPLPQIIKFIHSERSMNWKKKEMLWKTILLWNQWNKNFSLVKNIHYVWSKIVYHFSDIKINFVILIISMNHYINPILSHYKRYKLTRRGRESSSQGHTGPGDLTPCGRCPGALRSTASSDSPPPATRKHRDELHPCHYSTHTQFAQECSEHTFHFIHYTKGKCATSINF